MTFFVTVSSRLFACVLLAMVMISGADAVPIACFSASPNPLPVGSDLLLDAGCTVDQPLDPTDPPSALIEYQWDLDNDGNRDFTETTPSLLVTWAELSIDYGWAPGNVHQVNLLVFNSIEESGSTFRLVPVLDAQAVPGPIAGAGIPGLILASGGLLVWLRRRGNVRNRVGF